MITLSFLTALLFELNQPSYLDSASCSVQFSVYNAGFEVEGTMEVVQAEINFQPRDLDKSFVIVIADPSSVKTGISVRDRHLARSDFFDVKKYPEIILRSKNFRRKSKSEFVGEFDITIKSVTKEIIVPFTMEKKENGSHYKASFVINRMDFNVGEKSLTIDDEVKIFVTVID